MRSMTYEHAFFRATQKSPHSDSETDLACIDTTQAKQLWDKSTPPRRDWSRIFLLPSAPDRSRQMMSLQNCCPAGITSMRNCQLHLFGAILSDYHFVEANNSHARN